MSDKLSSIDMESFCAESWKDVLGHQLCLVTCHYDLDFTAARDLRNWLTKFIGDDPAATAREALETYLDVAEAQAEAQAAEIARLRGAIAFALGRLDPDSGGVPADLASALRMLADERAAWIEVAIAHNRGCAAENERKDEWNARLAESLLECANRLTPGQWNDPLRERAKAALAAREEGGE